MEKWAAALADSGLDTVDIAPGLADVFSVCNLSCSATIVAPCVTLDGNASLQHSHAAHENMGIRNSLHCWCLGVSREVSSELSNIPLCR